jgi:maltokinase
VPGSLRVVESGYLAGAQRLRVLWAIVEADGTEYQLFIGHRPVAEVDEHVAGPEEAVIVVSEGRAYYDATRDAETALELLRAASDGQEQAKLARPIAAEQSNTSLIYDDRMILKLFRRLCSGPSPDVEVTTALASVGFPHIALPLLRWQHNGRDLAFGQQYLAGGTEGWAMALTSLRDYYGTPAPAGFPGPAHSGGDFAAEAVRLGRVTAEMHLSMAAAFGVSDDALAGRWPDLVRSIGERLCQLGPPLASGASRLVEVFGAVRHPGPAVRVHGDYHLGQVMRTDGGWYVLDFEGEPARPLDQRLGATSPLKDVAGMLRSLQYASQFVLGERSADEAASLGPLARAWEERNRTAFLSGYYGCEGIGVLLPGEDSDREAVRLAFEVDKALYELAYEEAYRPDWARIPTAALRRFLLEPVDQLVDAPDARVGEVEAGTEEADQRGPGQALA